MAKIMTVRIPDNIQNYLQQQAKRMGYTRNGLVLQILWEWIREQKQNDQKGKEA